MLQVSRDNSLKIPKTVEVTIEKVNELEDIIETKEMVSLAEEKIIKKYKIKKEAMTLDKDLETSFKIPFNANDLIVITKLKKLTAYVIAVTQKSPAKYRGVFVNRMQNYCLDSLENLLQANFVKMDSIENKTKRADYQKEAIIKLKLLGYISMLALNVNCILKKQYTHISSYTVEVINLIVAWKKSDDKRFKNKN